MIGIKQTNKQTNKQQQQEQQQQTKSKKQPMSRPNKLTNDPPSEVFHAASELGRKLKVARLRRGLTINEVAQRIGTGARAVADAERGKLTTSILVYCALLLEFNLLAPFMDLAFDDEEGQRLLNMRMSSRAKKIKENAPRFKSDLGDDYFLSYWERHDRLDEGY